MPETRGRGRFRLRKLLDNARVRYGETNVDSLSSVAQKVDVSKIALPTSAGELSPSKYLCKERRKIVQDLHQLVKDESTWTSIRPCHLENAKRII